MGPQQRQWTVSFVRVSADQHLEADDQLSRFPYATALSNVPHTQRGTRCPVLRSHWQFCSPHLVFAVDIIEESNSEANFLCHGRFLSTWRPMQTILASEGASPSEQK